MNTKRFFSVLIALIIAHHHSPIFLLNTAPQPNLFLEIMTVSGRVFYHLAIGILVLLFINMTIDIREILDELKKNKDKN